jgi:hypothetical protein
MKREGYLMIDHRASPGLTEDIAHRLGLDPTQTKEGKLLEAATLTCSHCKNVVMKNPLRTRERAFCRKCMHYICDFCVMAADKPDYNHAPFEKTWDQILTAAENQTIIGSPRALLGEGASE